jgi:hypothetical protein
VYDPKWMQNLDTMEDPRPNLGYRPTVKATLGKFNGDMLQYNVRRRFSLD